MALRLRRVLSQVSENTDAWFEATRSGDLSALEELVATVDIDIVEEKSGCTALILASKLGHKKIFDFFVAAHANVNAVDAKLGRTALHYCIKIPDILTHVLKVPGVKCNVHDSEGITPLILVCKTKPVKVGPLQILLDAKANINAVDKQGRTAVMWAARNGAKDACAALCKAGAMVNYHDEAAGHTPLTLAASVGTARFMTQIVGMLLASNVQVNAQVRTTGSSALILAAKAGSTPVVTRLLKAKEIDVNLQNERKETALHAAAEQGSVKMTTALLNAKAHGSIMNVEGFTALHLAASNGHKDVVALLCSEPNASLNATDAKNHTPLYAACMNNDVEVMWLLLDAKANVDASCEGVTCLEMAAELGYQHSTSLLCTWGAAIESVLSDKKWNTYSEEVREVLKQHAEAMDICSVLCDALPVDPFHANVLDVITEYVVDTSLFLYTGPVERSD